MFISEKSILLRKLCLQSLLNVRHQMLRRKAQTCDRSHRKMTIKQWGTVEILKRMPSQTNFTINI